jgi:DNA-binding winged helix-turn-helix (wHTH) protein
LPPKDFVVLYHLVTHAGQLVTHAELLKAAWPNAIVSPKGLKAFVHRLRQKLGDKAAKPRFIETVARQGYRFVAAVATAPPVSGSKFQVLRSTPTPSTERPTPPLVGRDTELVQLRGWLDKAANGHRQIAFVIGEPGIGKTAVVDAFLQSLESRVQNHKERQKAKACPEHSRRGKNQKPVLNSSAPRRMNSGEGAKIEQASKGLQLLTVLPKTSARGQQELTLCPHFMWREPTSKPRAKLVSNS